MPRKKITVEAGGELKESAPRPYEITTAEIKDGYLHYGYELKTGVTAGDIVPKRKGGNIIHDDLRESMSKLNFHLGFIDYAIGDIELAENSALVANYAASGFTLSGEGDNQKISISGSKYTRFGYIDIDTPDIKLSGNYKHSEDLNSVVDNLIIEVEAYMNGKTAPKYEQTSLPFDENAAI